MIIREAAQEEIADLAALWKICFGDPDDYPLRFLAACIAQADSRVLVCEEGGTPQGMCCAVSVHAREHGKGAYLYALCTHPSHRGKGIAHALIDAARARYGFLCLIPASASLRAFYLAQGFVYPLSVPVGPARDGLAENPPTLIPALTVPSEWEGLCREALLCADPAHFTDVDEKEGKNCIPNRKIYEIRYTDGSECVIMKQSGLSTVPFSRPIAGLLPL